MSNTVSNLGITDKIPFTNIRLNKRGQIQYSTDGGNTYYNFTSGDREVLNLFAGPLDDIDGDGTSDNVTATIEDLKEKVQLLIDMGGGEGGESAAGIVLELKTLVEALESQVSDNSSDLVYIKGQIEDFQPMSDEDIISVFDKYKEDIE